MLAVQPVKARGVNALPWTVITETTVDRQYHPTFPRYLKELDGKEVALTGFMQTGYGGYSTTTVGDLRGWDTGNVNDINRHPLQNAWPTATSNDFAAYCTTGSSHVYTFYAVGPDRTAILP